MRILIIWIQLYTSTSTVFPEQFQQFMQLGAEKTRETTLAVTFVTFNPPPHSSCSTLDIATTWDTKQETAVMVGYTNSRKDGFINNFCHMQMFFMVFFSWTFAIMHLHFWCYNNLRHTHAEKYHPKQLNSNIIGTKTRHVILYFLLAHIIDKFTNLSKLGG